MPPHETTHGSLRAAFDLFEAGVALMRQNLRRQYPDAADDDIERRLQTWLHHRPGAETGDAVGRSVDPRIRFG